MNRDDLDLERLGAAAILDALSDGVYVTDRDRKILFWNEAAQKITGWRREDVVGRSCWDDVLVHIDKDGHRLCGHEFCPLHRSIVTGKRSGCPLTVFAQTRTGERVPVEVTVAPIRDSSGEIIGGIETFRDLSAMFRDLDLARIIQMHALEGPLPEDRRLRLDVLYTPQELVGGDFYRVERLDDNRYSAMVADVAGHGITSALFVMQIRSMWEDLRSYRADPGGFMARLAGQLHVMCSRDDFFATAVYVVIDASTGAIEYVNAGHPSPLVAHADGRVERLTATGPVLGFSGEARFAPAAAQLEPGETLLLYTDGATEVFSAEDRELSEEGLMRLVAEHDLSEGRSALERIEEALLKFCNQLRLPDDMTLLGVHRPSGSTGQSE
jgi:PAS domain S-box-containing protein